MELEWPTSEPARRVPACGDAAFGTGAWVLGTGSGGRMFRIDPVELAAGVFIIAVGLFFLIGGLQYQVGTVARIGPGFLPVALGAIAIGLGAMILLAALGEGGETPEISPRAAGAVLGAIGAFALLLPRVGLLPTIVVTVMIAVLGNREATLRFALTTAVVLAALCWLLFIQILGLSMPVIRSPL